MEVKSYAFNADVTWDAWARNQTLLIAQHHGIELTEDQVQNWLATELGYWDEQPENTQLIDGRAWARCDGNSVPHWPDWMVEPDISAIIILHPNLPDAFLKELVIREKNYARPFCHKDWGDTSAHMLGDEVPSEIIPNDQFPLGCSNLAESEYCTHWFTFNKLGVDPKLPTLPQEGYIIAYRNCYCS